MVLRRIGVWSAARLYGGLCAVLGLLFGVIFALVALAGGMAGMASDGGAGGAGLVSGPFGAIFGVGAIIALPLFYGVLGVIMGALTAVLYNLFAGLFGGIELETQ